MRACVRACVYDRMFFPSTREGEDDSTRNTEESGVTRDETRANWRTEKSVTE